LKTYIPPADKILDANAQECAKKAGMELAIQTYTFDDMRTKYTAAIESKALPDIAEVDAVGPARLANLNRLADMSDVVSAVTKDLGPILANAEGAVKLGGKFYAATGPPACRRSSTWCSRWPRRACSRPGCSASPCRGTSSPTPSSSSPTTA
jgi:ABC-type glycerol-3-phosphate transport system substrate-binding protein